MKRKTKLIAMVMSICLVCAVFAIGVFALKTANLKIGGDVSFSATGVEADIKNVTLTGATTNDQVLATGSINTSMTQADIDTKFQNWQSLKLFFDENATDIELKFQIANTSTNADNYIEMDYSYSFSNANPNIDVFPGDENDQKVWENNEYILAPKGSATNATYETFTLKFKVLDKELNVPQDTKVSVNIELKHITPVGLADGESVVDSKMKATDGIIYTLNTTNHTASLGTYDGDIELIGDNFTYTDANLKIAPVVTDGTDYYIVTTIEEWAFYDGDNSEDNEYIENVIIPNSIISIGPDAFIGCANMTCITIGNGVTSIGSYAFGWCGSLTSITIPSSVTSIGEMLFSDCSSLTTITIPNGVTSIGGDAFKNCKSLTSITIPSSVTSIGGGAFSGCSSLTSVTIPSSVTSIGGNAFNNTPWYNNQPDGLIYINNVLYAYKGTMPAGTSIEVKEGTVSILDSAFHSCTGLTSITIPSSVTSIGGSAFRNCSSLTSITIPSSVTSIGWYAFRDCTNLTSVKFEETTGWYVVDSADEERTPIAESEFTTDASAANARLLTTTYRGNYWFRTVE